MDMKERRDRQLAYVADAAVMEEMAECRRILQKSSPNLCVNCS